MPEPQGLLTHLRSSGHHLVPIPPHALLILYCGLNVIFVSTKARAGPWLPDRLLWSDGLLGTLGIMKGLMSK